LDKAIAISRISAELGPIIEFTYEQPTRGGEIRHLVKLTGITNKSTGMKVVAGGTDLEKVIMKLKEKICAAAESMHA
jgi:hypothetical protein